MQTSIIPITSVRAIPDWMELVRHRAEDLCEGRITLNVEEHQVITIECEERTRVFVALSMDNCADTDCEQSSSGQLTQS
jgi:hypothetical protein